MIHYTDLERFHASNTDSIILLVESADVANEAQAGTVSSLEIDNTVYTTTATAEEYINNWLNNN